MTLDGVHQWGSFNQSQFFKYFLIPGYRNIPILAKARAWDLSIWLQPFIDKVEHSKDLTNPRALLSQFAWWVYCSSTYWATQKQPGLHIQYDNRKKTNKFAFYPSLKAKSEWLKTIASLGYDPCGMLK